MKFGNPVSSVTISGGTVAITAAGTLSTTGVVTSVPSATVPPTTVAAATAGPGATAQLIANATGTNFYILSQLVISVYDAGGLGGVPGLWTVQLTGASSTVLATFALPNTAGNNINTVIPMNGFPTPPLCGISITSPPANAGTQIAVSAYYTPSASAGSTFSGHVITT